MQLTMPILADGLAEYRLETAISATSGEIAGIRLGPGRLDDPYVFLAQDGENVICCSGRDCIRVCHSSVSQVFNTISSLFERLSAWEHSLNEIIYNNGSLGDLINCSSEVLGNPIFVVDEREIVFAMTDHPVGTVDSEWDYMLKHGRMPYNRVSAIYHDSDFKSVRRASEIDNRPVIFQPPGMSSRGINFRIPDPSADAFLGTLCIVEHDRPFTDGLLHLSRILTQSIVKWTRVHEHDHNMKNISHLFADLLEGVKVDEGEIAMTKSLNDMEDDLFVLAVMPAEGANRLSHVAPVLEGEIERSLCFDYKGHLLMLCAYNPDQKAFTEKLQSLADDMQIRIGISYPFNDWRAMKSAFKQANIALGYGRDRLSRLNPNSAMSYLVSELSLTLHGSNIMHPALKILDRHDREHGTQYYSTLSTYLKHERNLVKTAAALFIHRNSLVYRMARIQELIDVDLEDYAVRHYLLLSFQCQATWF